MMSNIPTGAVAHLGLALVLSYLLKLQPIVTVFCAILPDLIDKPLTVALNTSIEGRYIAHTLLFVAVVALAFYLWKRRYGLAALVGGLSHLLLDIAPNNTLFYPFVKHEFQRGQADFWSYLRHYFTWEVLGTEVAFVVLAALAAFLLLKLYNRHKVK
jgi:F0F1-type ATP synthase assembly protein I